MLAIASLHKLGDASHVGLSQPVQLPLQLLGQPLQQDLLLFTLTLLGFQSFSDCRRQVFSPTTRTTNILSLRRWLIWNDGSVLGSDSAIDVFPGLLVFFKITRLSSLST